MGPRLSSPAAGGTGGGVRAAPGCRDEETSAREMTCQFVVRVLCVASPSLRAYAKRAGRARGTFRLASWSRMSGLGSGLVQRCPNPRRHAQGEARRRFLARSPSVWLATAR
eukprot:359517-Chlamydomonas_euryale.AAC.3